MKRMIDNKEFDALKTDVNELEAKVDNIKDIPTITIGVAQMTDESHAQLTDEQFEIIENNSFINVVFPNGTSCGFNRFIDAYEGYHLAMCSGDTSVITYFSASVDSTTKIATIAIGEFSGGGKQLYQHNIDMEKDTGSEVISIHFKITNDNPNSMTFDEVYSYIRNVAKKYYQNNSGNHTRLYEASGGAGQNYNPISGIYACTDTSFPYIVVVYISSGNFFYKMIDTIKNDDVAPL